MYKKVFLQLLLIILLFTVIISTFFFYFYKEEQPKKTNILIEKNENKKAQVDKNTGTLIKDINYSFFDDNGSSYTLISEYGEVNIYNSDKIFMTNVTATIYLANSSPIVITSKHADYDKSNHETKFFKNVEVNHLVHKATGQNLDLSFKNNMASMYNNIIYKKPGTQMTADRLNIDLVTKDTKIFMNKKAEKIKIIDKQ